MPRNKHPEQTVELILDTAAALFTRQGYDKTTLQDILNATHLSKGAIYHHFASKEEILIAVVNRIGEHTSAVLAEVRDRPGLTGAEKLRELFRTSLTTAVQGDILYMMPFLLENPHFLALQMKSIFDEAAPYYALPILKEGIADGSIQTQYPEELAEAFLILSDLWLQPVLRPSTQEQMRRRCALYNELTEQYGFRLLDDDLIEQLAAFCRS